MHSASMLTPVMACSLVCCGICVLHTLGASMFLADQLTAWCHGSSLLLQKCFTSLPKPTSRVMFCWPSHVCVCLWARALVHVPCVHMCECIFAHMFAHFSTSVLDVT